MVNNCMVTRISLKNCLKFFINHLLLFLLLDNIAFKIHFFISVFQKRKKQFQRNGRYGAPEKWT